MKPLSVGYREQERMDKWTVDSLKQLGKMKEHQQSGLVFDWWTEVSAVIKRKKKNKENEQANNNKNPNKQTNKTNKPKTNKKLKN